MRDHRPTPRNARTLLAPLVSVVALLAAACGGLGDAIPSISLPPPPGATGSTGATGAGATGSATPSSSAVAGSLNQGQASISVSGGVNVSVTLGTLTDPGLWTPPPGSIALSWTGPTDQVLTLAGPSFTSQIATDDSHTLSLTVNADGVPVAFVSDAGECTVAISPALPTQMGGTFLCTDLASTDDTVTVNAQGTFSATG